MMQTEQLLQQILTECHLSPKFATKIDDFLQFMLQSNKELNILSRKLTVNDILTDHIADCLVGVQYFADSSIIADLGTGGGLPGMLLAIVFPDKQIKLYEKSPKKCDYLIRAKKHLALENVTINNVVVANNKFDCDVITCRAFKSIQEILAMTVNFFNRGGRYILYKARLENIEQDLAIVKQKYRVKYSIEKLGNREDKERNMVFLQKF